MSTPTNIILHSRPRAEADWECARKRFYLYEWDGTGLSVEEESLQMFRGTSIHDGLAAIATLWKRDGKVDIDLIANTAFKQVHDAVATSAGGTRDDIAEFALEQGTLIEGLMRGFYRHQWPLIVQRWPRILAIETDVTYYHDVDGVGTKKGPFGFMAKPDLVVASEDESEVVYCVVPETRVLTANLIWKEIGEIAVNDHLIGVEELPNVTQRDKNGQGRRYARRWSTGRVTKTRRLIKPCFKLTFTDGTVITCSSDHQWLVPKCRSTKTAGGSFNADWVVTEKLTVGKKLLKIVEPWEPCDWSDYDRGYIRAALEGEGCLAQKATSRAMQLSFSQRPGAMLDTFRETLSRNMIRFLKSKNGGGTNKDVFTTSICGKDQVLRVLGITRPQRMLDKLDINNMGGAWPIKQLRLAVIEFIGDKEVVALETTNHTFLAEGIISHNCEYKSTSSKKEQWINSWDRTVQVHATREAIAQDLGIDCTGVVVQGLYTGYESYGKLASPMCYAYHRWGNPPFTQNETLYEYRSGFKRYPVWQLEGGIKKWVDEMPEDVLMEQFPQTPLIFPNADMMAKFFSQRAHRELEIRQARNMIKSMEDGPSKDDLLARHFPQTFNKCKPAWGYECPLQHLCFGSINDPLKAGMSRREAHHSAEVAQIL